MTTQTYEALKEACSQFLEQFFTTRGAYSKFDSAENRTAIVERMATYQLPPSNTAVRRAILELENEGAIERADGGDEESDAVEEAQAAQDRDRQTALAQPLNQNDARLYSSLSMIEITDRCKNDRLFRFRYQEACKLWGFRFPQGFEDSPSELIDDEEATDLPRTYEEYRAIPSHTTAQRWKQEPRFRRRIQRLIDEGKI